MPQIHSDNTPVYLLVTLNKGKDYSQAITVTDANGNNFDFTGYTVTMKFTNVNDLDTDILTISSASEITLATGSMTIALSDTQADNFSQGTYRHEIQFDDGSGTTSVEFNGFLDVIHSIN